MNIVELKVEMLRNGINQTQLAKKMDITKSSLNKKFKGVNEFTRKDILQIKEIFSLTPERINEIFFDSKVELNSTSAV